MVVCQRYMYSIVKNHNVDATVRDVKPVIFNLLLIHNGNRSEWSPIRFVIVRVINKIGRPRSGELGETRGNSTRI